MRDEDIDLSEVPEVTAEDLRGAVLRVDSDLVEELRKRAGEKGLQRMINKTLRASLAKA